MGLFSWHNSQYSLRFFRSFYQILENERLLLVLLDQDRAVIYLERLVEMDMAIERNRHAKSLSREKLGNEVLFAFDEAKRALAVCSSTKVYDYWLKRA
jgi:hypothetical protein